MLRGDPTKPYAAQQLRRQRQTPKPLPANNTHTPGQEGRLRNAGQRTASPVETFTHGTKRTKKWQTPKVAQQADSVAPQQHWHQGIRCRAGLPVIRQAIHHITDLRKVAGHVQFLIAESRKAVKRQKVA
jgi:hypothetical protein